MNLRGYPKLSMQEALQALDEMPKERDTGHYAGRAATAGLGRTYTRMDGDRFEISQTAGMASAVVSGLVSESGGRTVIDLAIYFGLVPNRYWLRLSVLLVLIAPIMYAWVGWETALVAVVLGFAALIPYMAGRSDVNFVLSRLSEALGGVEWQRPPP